MIFKVLVLGAVIFLVYIVFFKKSRENEINTKKNNENESIDTMVECPTCNVLLSKDEAITSDTKYYCSTECLNK